MSHKVIDVTRLRHIYWCLMYFGSVKRTVLSHVEFKLFHTSIVNRPDPSVSHDISVARMRPTALDGIARQFPGPTMSLKDRSRGWGSNGRFPLPTHIQDYRGAHRTLIKTQRDYTFFKSIFWWSGVVSPHTLKSGGNAFEKLAFGSDVFNGELEEFDRELERYLKMLETCGVPPEAPSNIFACTLWKVLNRKP
jgi:hypothetical protein